LGGIWKVPVMGRRVKGVGVGGPPNKLRSSNVDKGTVNQNQRKSNEKPFAKGSGSPRKGCGSNFLCHRKGESKKAARKLLRTFRKYEKDSCEGPRVPNKKRKKSASRAN